MQPGITTTYTCFLTNKTMCKSCQKFIISVLIEIIFDFNGKFWPLSHSNTQYASRLWHSCCRSQLVNYFWFQQFNMPLTFTKSHPNYQPYIIFNPNEILQCERQSCKISSRGPFHCTSKAVIRNNCAKNRAMDLFQISPKYFHQRCRQFVPSFILQFILQKREAAREILQMGGILYLVDKSIHVTTNSLFWASANLYQCASNNRKPSQLE